MIAINKLLVMIFLVAFLCIEDINPGLAQSNWQQQQWQQQQQRQQEMLRQQQLQQQRMMESQRQQQQQQQQQQIQRQQAQQRQMQQRQIQQQRGSAGLRQNSANREFPAKNQIPRVQNTPRTVIKAPQSTTNSLKNSTSLSSRAQKAKQTADDLAYKQKMKNRLLLIKKNKEERRLANLRKAEKERLDKEKDSKILNYEFNKRAYGVTVTEKDGKKSEDWEKVAPNKGFLSVPTKTTVPQGTIIDRYGDGKGTFASPYKTPLENRSLATGAERLPYSVYKVIKPIPALSGQAAPAFGKEGKGTQYNFDKSMDELEREGYIKKIN